MSNTDESRRTKILDAIKDRFETVTASSFEDNPDGYRYKYSQVSRSSYSNSPKGKNLSMYVHGGTENKFHKAHPKKHVNMSVVLEIYYLREKNIEPVRALEKLVAEAERRVMEDETFGNLAISCIIDNVMIETDGRFDNHSEAALVMTVLFSHHRADPRKGVYNA